MKKVIFIPLIFIIITVTACGAFVFKKDDESSKNTKETKELIVFKMVKEIVQNYHYHRLELNDEFSRKATKSLIENIDNGKRFLLKSDVNKILAQELKIDDEFENNSLKTFEIYNDFIAKREKYVAEVIEDFLKKPISLHSKDIIQLDEDSIDFCKNKKELKKRWEDYLTFSVLEKIYQLEKRKDSTSNTITIEELELKAREDVADKFNDWMKRLGQQERSDRFNLYVNSILAVYDPHTQYFPPKDKEDFDIQFSGKLEGIGATLMVKDGYIKVSKIVPGSASWKQGQLEAGDLILEVAQGDQTPVDVYDMRLDKAVRLIRGPKGEEVRLTVKKVTGEVVIIPIIRDIVVIEETYAKSLILKSKKDSVKYGYISLESFYADFQDKNGRFSGEDVLEELESLKKSGAKGVILDLRNNGGGSLTDAVKMVGFFIKKGAVVQVDGVNQKPEVYEDYDPRVQFELPLVVMVNNFSASASEIFAAAIQDYNRGIVVGVNTFGKGTVQRFLDLDEVGKLNNINNEYYPLGSIKQTIAKFYRVNGGATQLKGVSPDILLPEPYMFIEIGEKEYDFALPWSSIKKSNYQPFVPKYNLDSLITHSMIRIEKDSFFNTMENNAKHIKKIQSRGSYPLDIDKLRALKERIEKENEKFQRKMTEFTDWEVSFNSKDIQLMEKDSIVLDRMNKFKDLVKKDNYIHESLNILKEIPLK